MRTATLLLLGGLLAGTTGCSPKGSYTLSWFITGEASSDALGCSSHGVDGIQVLALKAGNREPADLVVFPCAPHYGERKLTAGDYFLQVTPVNGRGARMTDPETGAAIPAVEIAVKVPSDGTTYTDTVEITSNPACSDGVDNDGDGLVDLGDPDCDGPLGESEEPAPTP
jgi:hypothetical protein